MPKPTPLIDEVAEGRSFPVFALKCGAALRGSGGDCSWRVVDAGVRPSRRDTDS